VSTVLTLEVDRVEDQVRVDLHVSERGEMHTFGRVVGDLAAPEDQLRRRARATAESVTRSIASREFNTGVLVEDTQRGDERHVHVAVEHALVTAIYDAMIPAAA
jgi:hypothetical protein